MNLETNHLRKRALAGELLIGTFLNLGSSITAEIAGKSGFDWLLIDMEHGSGHHGVLPAQLQAASATSATPLVRIVANDPIYFKQVLDLGALGVMVPYISTPTEAEQAVQFMRYPPRGIRGVAKSNRASNFGLDFDTYFEKSHEALLTVVQIETQAAIENIEQIAAVDGIDVLFIGPLDLSVNLGIPQQFDHEKFKEAKARVVKAAQDAGKSPGILLFSADQIESGLQEGFKFISLGSDGGLVAAGMRNITQAFVKYKA